MPNKSKKNQSKNYNINIPQQDDVPEKIDKAGLNVKGCQVNFFYFDTAYQRFDAWEKNELKKFTQWLDKTRKISADALKDKASTHIHKGNPKPPPHSLEDIAIHSVAIQESGSLRVHGTFEGDNFYVFWLDRKHKICS